MKQYKRSRILYGFIFIIVVCLGLYSRSSLTFPLFLKQYAGDVLWATMVYSLLCVIVPKISWKLAIGSTLLFSFCIEFSQLLTFDWLLYLRTTPLRYILGQGFVWSDLLCYSIGCLLAFGIDYTTYQIQKKRGDSPLINHVQ